MTELQADDLKVRTIHPQITTLTVPFNRFAPFGRNASRLTFVAVGNRATAIHLPSNKILLLNPIPLTPAVKTSLDSLGGVDYIACDLGHHMNAADYLKAYPSCKTIGVQGLDFKRRDVPWDFIYSTKDGNKKPEEIFAKDFGNEIEILMFEGFITRAVAWLHKPSHTLIVSDLLMSLPATEQYLPSSSASQGPFSWAFSQVANPYSLFFRGLIYYIATVEYALVRRDAKTVAEWDFERIVTCHGDVIEGGKEAWCAAYRWFLEGRGRTGLRRGLWDRWMGVMRRVGLGAW